MTRRTLTALAALAAVGLGAALGARVAERMRARFGATPIVPVRTEPPVLERLAYYPVPAEWNRDILMDGPITCGDATLRLRLRDDRDGRPAAMPVRLWRLDVPADDACCAGDEVRASLNVPEKGVTIEWLPAGRYRLQCLDARAGFDPPEFEVEDGMNDRELEVPSRQPFRVRMLLVDERGAVVRRSIHWDDWEEEARPGDVQAGAKPWWATRRTLTLGESCGFVLGGGCGPGRVVPMRSPGSDGYLDLGRLREAGRYGYVTLTGSIPSESRATVTYSVSETFGVDSTLVGVAPSHAALLAHVVFADGWPVDASEATVKATSDAARHAWDAPADAWRNIPVFVTVTVAKHLPLEFEWTAETAGEAHVLVPLPPRIPR